MDKLDEEYTKLKELGYQSALSLLNEGSKTTEITDSNGTEYQIQYLASYDDKKAQSIRVIVSLWKPKKTSLLNPISWFNSPVHSKTFIILPDGSFVGEQFEEYVRVLRIQY